MRIEIASDVSLVELQRVIALMGAKLIALPDGAFAIRKPKPEENPKCRSKK